MDIKVSLDDKWVNEWEASVATIISDELNSSVRLAVRSVVKSNLGLVQKKVDAVVKGMLAKLSVEEIQKMVKE